MVIFVNATVPIPLGGNRSACTGAANAGVDWYVEVVAPLDEATATLEVLEVPSSLNLFALAYQLHHG